MNIINKNLIYLFCSILLGLSISYFYVKKINKLFLIYFFIITSFIYILFYFLGNTQENFVNIIIKESKPMEYIEQEITTEEEEFILEGEEKIVQYILQNPDSYNDNELLEEDNHISENENNIPLEEDNNIPLEEEHNIPLEEEHNIPLEEEHNMNYYPSEEHNINYNMPSEEDNMNYYPSEEDNMNYYPSEEHNMNYNMPSEEHNMNYNMPLEEHNMNYNMPSEEHDLYNSVSNKTFSNNLIQEDHVTHEEESSSKNYNLNSQGKDKNNLQFTAPNGIPFNINISYNSQNSTNNLDNNKVQTSNIESISERSNRMIPQQNKTPEQSNKKSENKKNNQNKCNKNLGTYNYSDSRIYNNSDWIYGNYAWTNEPDYYIPEESTYELPRPAKKDISSYNNCPSIPISQPLNKLISSKNFKNNTNVCPMAINTPWTEYKSGDSEPEPFNL